MDICTLVIPTMATLLACSPTATQCHVSADGARQFCAAGPPANCNHSAPTYVCARPNKTTYSLPWTADPDTNILITTSP